MVAKRKAGAKSTDSGDQIIEAALRLAGERGWSGLALADIAAEAKLNLAELYAAFPSKSAILAAFSRSVDRQVLAAVEPAGSESARDRLFDVLMRRFDALAPRREALAAIAKDTRRDPSLVLAGAGQLFQSMSAMLEAAGISSAGVSGAIRAKALAIIYLATMRDWLMDDTVDKAKTMAALDGRLRRAESWAGWLHRKR